MNREKKIATLVLKIKFIKARIQIRKKSNNQEYKLLYCDHMPKKARVIYGEIDNI